jgi:hypothetical protein
MKKMISHIGLDVHKESIAVAIASGSRTEVRHYGIIGGTLDAMDKLIKKLSQPGIELRLVYEAGPCGFVIARRLSLRVHCARPEHASGKDQKTKERFTLQWLAELAASARFWRTLVHVKR